MDEWTGEVFEGEYNTVREALAAMIPAIEDAVKIKLESYRPNL
jgi:hypothetical protein